MKKLNLNFDFLLDIWADLKAKKLAPVAIGLVVAAVAIPALLMKGEKTATDGPLPILASSAAEGPQVEVAEELADRGSKLDSYSARDPFKGKVKPDDDSATGTGTASVPSSGGGESDKGSSGSTGSPLGSGGSTGSSGTTGPSGDGGLGSTPTPIPTTPPELDIPKPKRRLYTFQLDLNFGRPGREQHYPAVKRMTFLPRPTLPALLFMGVPEGERAAIFFVYPGMTHQGEGRCMPSPKNCNFLHLGIGQEHYLAANDHEFRIELLKVKRVPLSTEKKQRAKARKASQRRLSRGGTEGAADASTGQAVEEILPWLVDGMSG